MDELVSRTVPANILLDRDLNIGDAKGESIIVDTFSIHTETNSLWMKDLNHDI